MELANLHIGTCSWKYDSWQGLIYPDKKPFNYLREYSSHYKTVEVDQWFWSLFPGNKVVLPKPSVVQEYAESVPDNFTFGIKVPNSITLTHYYKKHKAEPQIENPHFLSVELMEKFLDSLTPIDKNLGPLIFQFEYLNRQKMSGIDQFVSLFGEFAERLPDGYSYCVEIRNPNYLKANYFDFLGQIGFHHVFLQGYYMPSIFDLYSQQKDTIRSLSVMRLHGPDRKGIEKETGENWNQIIAPKDNDLSALSSMLSDLDSRNVESFLFVNNHFEGSAPRTIQRIDNLLKSI